MKERLFRWCFAHLNFLSKIEIQSETGIPVLYLSLRYFPKGCHGYKPDMFSYEVRRDSIELFRTSVSCSVLIDFIKKDFENGRIFDATEESKVNKKYLSVDDALRMHEAYEKSQVVNALKKFYECFNYSITYRCEKGETTAQVLYVNDLDLYEQIAAEAKAFILKQGFEVEELFSPLSDDSRRGSFALYAKWAEPKEVSSSK